MHRMQPPTVGLFAPLAVLGRWSLSDWSMSHQPVLIWGADGVVVSLLGVEHAIHRLGTRIALFVAMTKRNDDAEGIGKTHTANL